MHWFSWVSLVLDPIAFDLIADPGPVRIQGATVDQALLSPIVGVYSKKLHGGGSRLYNNRIRFL
jgi:hypothetical protein